MEISKQSVKTAFGNAVDTYDASAIVQSEILSRLLEKLKLMSVSVDAVLDLGSGTGNAQTTLQELFGQQNYYALDIALPMVQFASKKYGAAIHSAVCGDAEALPYQSDSFDLVFSASTLQWCNELAVVFADCHRVLRTNGLFIFSLFGPDTLLELRHSFAQVDPHPRVKTFLDMHLLGDLLLQTGFNSPVMEAEKLTVEYQDPMQLLRDLKATGATNKLSTRSRGLLTKRQVDAALCQYKKFILPNGRYPATYEVIFGHAWKPDLASKRRPAQNDWHPIQFFKD